MNFQILIIKIRASGFEWSPQTLPVQLTQPRHPYGTQKISLSAAPFLTWHGSKVLIAQDQDVNATYIRQLYKQIPEGRYHFC